MIFGLLGFSRSLACNFMSLNNEQCKTRSVYIDLNLVELNYYLLMISLH